MSQSGLTPAQTFRHVTPVEPIHGTTSKTTRQNSAQGPTMAMNRAGDRPSSRRRNDVIAAAIGSFEDSGGDFKDVIKVLWRQDLVGTPVYENFTAANRNHTFGITSWQI